MRRDTGFRRATSALRRGLGAAAILVLALACDDRPDAAADARVSGGEWARGGAWTLAPGGVRIGAVDGPEELTFGRVAGVVVGVDGRIHVGDAQANEVRVFSAGGDLITRFGRPGEGPGELRNISGLARAPDGIAVLDGMLGRVTIFRADGTVARMFRLQRPYMILRHGAVMRFDDRARFYDHVPLASRPGVDSIGVVVYSPEGEPADTVLVDVVEHDHLLVERDGVLVMSFPRPFAPQPSLAIGPDGRIHHTRGDEYRITVLAPDGDSIRVIRRDVRPRPVTAAERDSATAAIEERYREAAAGVPRGITLPATKPTILNLVVDRAGNLWVLQHADPDGGLEWGVHAPDGRYLGAVATPVMHVMDIGEDYIAGVSRDDLDVQRVEVRRLVKP